VTRLLVTELLPSSSPPNQCQPDLPRGYSTGVLNHRVVGGAVVDAKRRDTHSHDSWTRGRLLPPDSSAVAPGCYLIVPLAFHSSAVYCVSRPDLLWRRAVPWGRCCSGSAHNFEAMISELEEARRTGLEGCGERGRKKTTSTGSGSTGAHVKVDLTGKLYPEIASRYSSETKFVDRISVMASTV